jgi:glutamine synthetase
MKDLRERLAAARVHTLLVQFTDIHGTAKGKLVPLSELDHVLAVGAGFAGPSIWGTGLPRTGPRSEYYARGSASTAMPLPWMPGVARIVGDGYVDGEPFDACPRQVLRRALARLARHGWDLQLGIEPEFFLLDRDAPSPASADPRDRLDKPSYDLQSLLRRREPLLALQQGLAACGLRVLQTDHEDAHGQFELNFLHDTALTSCDNVMLFKLGAHAIAEQHGLRFSMMPKPFGNQPGSGLHFHVSMWEGHGDDARCVFVPHRADGSADRTRELSALGRHFMAGVLAHSRALCALAAPTVNSYKRLVVGESLSGTSWAPASIAQGPNNRTALVRTLHGRFEWRLPDASANPYLAAAGLAAAGLDGIERGLEPPPDCTDDLFTFTPAQLHERGIGLLPQSLSEACDALEQDETICAALGSTLTEQFLRLKRDEATEYARHVSEWEFRRYADLF